MKKIQNIYDNDEFFKAYKAIRENDEGFNNLIEQPAIFSLLPKLDDKAILEIGCGFGEFAKYAATEGAKSVFAIDASANMLKVAKTENQHPNIIYQQIPVEDLECRENSFDLIVSSLVFHYVENLELMIKEIISYLKTNGFLIFSVEHPICTAYTGGIIKTDQQGNLFHPVYNYRDEKLFEQKWLVEGVKKYHRKVSTYINILIDNELIIERVLEPMPDDQLIAKRAEFIIHKIRPPLLLIKARK